MDRPDQTRRRFPSCVNEAASGWCGDASIAIGASPMRRGWSGTMPVNYAAPRRRAAAYSSAAWSPEGGHDRHRTINCIRLATGMRHIAAVGCVLRWRFTTDAAAVPSRLSRVDFTSCCFRPKSTDTTNCDVTGSSSDKNTSVITTKTLHTQW